AVVCRPVRSEGPGGGGGESGRLKAAFTGRAEGRGGGGRAAPGHPGQRLGRPFRDLPGGEPHRVPAVDPARNRLATGPSSAGFSGEVKSGAEPGAEGNGAEVRPSGRS